MITTDRDVYVAGHTTDKVKKALRAEADRRGCSMSALLHAILAKALKIEMPPEPLYIDGRHGR